MVANSLLFWIGKIFPDTEKIKLFEITIKLDLFLDNPISIDILFENT